MYKLLWRRSLVLHLLQDGDDHVKLGPLGWVFVHAEPHQFTDMRWNPRWNGWPKTFERHLSNRGARYKVAFNIPNIKICKSLGIFWRYGVCVFGSKGYRDVGVDVQYKPVGGLILHPRTFMPISMCERSAKGTSLVTSSHSNTAKLHMSADLLLMSSGLFCRAEKQEGQETP